MVTTFEAFLLIVLLVAILIGVYVFIKIGIIINKESDEEDTYFLRAIRFRSLADSLYLECGVLQSERDEARAWARKMKAERDYYKDRVGLQEIDAIRNNLVEMRALNDRLELDKTKVEIVQLKESLERIKNACDVDLTQFNDGYCAYERGESDDSQPHYELDYDSWRIGWVWARYINDERGKSRVDEDLEKVKAERDQANTDHKCDCAEYTRLRRLLTQANDDTLYWRKQAQHWHDKACPDRTKPFTVGVEE